jgi:hypothetical protein
VPGAARPFFIPVVYSPLGPWVTWQHRSPPLEEVRPVPRDSARAHLDRETRSRTEKHVIPSELSSRGGRTWSMGHVAVSEPTSTGRRGPELRNTWQRRSSTQQGGEARGHMPRGNTEDHLSKEVRSGTAGHVAAPEPTSAGRCDLKLQLAWQRVDAHAAPCLDLEFVCGGTRSTGCRQRPPGPPQERLQTRRWG